MIDLRSDTVTRPSPAMLQAMVSAPLGDDVMGDDPTVIQLQQAVAERAGKVVLGYYAEGEAIEVELKADDSPVTAADVACEEFI
ncbi:MAG: beta-eliminating lyase-related protein, partial [Achromobacter sp.]|nr:beta-eliminating lyase-related protein [Achromobacter sp.]